MLKLGKTLTARVVADPDNLDPYLVVKDTGQDFTPEIWIKLTAKRKLELMKLIANA